MQIGVKQGMLLGFWALMCLALAGDALSADEPAATAKTVAAPKASSDATKPMETGETKDPAKALDKDSAVANAQPPVTRIALLLPTHSESLKNVADAVRAGFYAALEREGNGIEVELIETDDSAENIVSNFVEAQQTHDYIVGPLTRSGLLALVHSAKATKPTVALAQADQTGADALVLPPNILAIGLSIEDEARQAANYLAAERHSAKVLVLSSNIAWQKRAAKAFAAQAKQKGMTVDAVELEGGGGYLATASLQDLQKSLQADKNTVLFLALDANQARQVRSVVGRGVSCFGTSQLNPSAKSDPSRQVVSKELEGTRMFDMPWQLQPDHPAVMIFPHLVPSADQKMSAEIDRLYALGIDAYRVVHELTQHHTHFDLDGVTGRLTVNFGDRNRRFERVQLLAVVHDGVAQAAEAVRH